MGKKRVNAASRRGGEVITVDGAGDLGRISLRGPLGAMGNIGVTDVLPPIIGGVLALAGTLASRFLARAYSANPGDTFFYTTPQIAGGVFGVLASIPMYWWKGSKAMVSSMVTAGVVAAAWYGYELVQAKVDETATDIANKRLAAGSTSGLGLLSVSNQNKQLRGLVATGAGSSAPNTASMPSAVHGAVNPGVFGRRAY